MNNWNTPLTNFQTVQLFWSMTQRRYVIRASLLAARNAIAFTLQPASKKSVCIVTLVLAKWRRNRFPVGSRGQTASNGQSPWARSGQETKQTTHLHFVPRLGIGGVHFRSRHVRNWHNAAYQSAKFFFFATTLKQAVMDWKGVFSHICLQGLRLFYGMWHRVVLARLHGVTIRLWHWGRIFLNKNITPQSWYPPTRPQDVTAQPRVPHYELSPAWTFVHEAR